MQHSDLIEAITAKHDQATVLERVYSVIHSAGFDSTYGDEEARDAVVAEFMRVLAPLPTWAIMAGFDNWQRSRGGKKPGPGNIFAEAEMLLNPFRRELDRRSRDRGHQRLEAQKAERMSAEMAERIKQAAGFTTDRMKAMHRKPMSLTFAEAEMDTTDRPLHWSETVDPNGPEMQALRRARAENQIIQQARKSAKLEAIRDAE